MFDLVVFDGEYLHGIWFTRCSGWFMEKDFKNPRPALYTYNPRISESDPLVIFKDNKEANAFYYQLKQTKKISKKGNTFYNLDTVMKNYIQYKKSVNEEIETRSKDVISRLSK